MSVTLPVMDVASDKVGDRVWVSEHPQEDSVADTGGLSVGDTERELMEAETYCRNRQGGDNEHCELECSGEDRERNDSEMRMRERLIESAQQTITSETVASVVAVHVKVK